MFSVLCQFFLWEHTRHVGHLMVRFWLKNIKFKPYKRHKLLDHALAMTILVLYELFHI